MPPPPLRRHVAFPGDEVPPQNWHSRLVDGEFEPDKVISWVEDNLTGPWHLRHAPDQDVLNRLGHATNGRFFFYFFFQEKSDFDRFNLWYGATGGSA